jgi:chromosome segregation ATPase
VLGLAPGGGGGELAARLQASEAECQRLLANIQSMKAALKDAAETVRAARGEAADARAATQAEKEERAAERARVAAEEKDVRQRREAAQAGLARFVQRAAQVEAIARLVSLHAKTVRAGGA